MHKRTLILGLTLSIALSHVVPTSSAAAESEPAAATAPTGNPDAEGGLAAVYNDRLQGHITACGEKYDRNALTTAHKSLPCNTLVKLTHRKNHRSVTVRVNDRGPTQAGRVVDITPRAAKALGMRKISLFEVDLHVSGKGKKPTAGKGHRHR